MAEMKIREIAKECKRSSSEIIQICVRSGLRNVTEETVLSDNSVKNIRAILARRAADEAKKAKEEAAEAAKNTAAVKKKPRVVIFGKGAAVRKKPAAAEKPAETAAGTAARAPETAETQVKSTAAVVKQKENAASVMEKTAAAAAPESAKSAESTSAKPAAEPAKTAAEKPAEAKPKAEQTVNAESRVSTPAAADAKAPAGHAASSAPVQGTGASDVQTRRTDRRSGDERTPEERQNRVYGTDSANGQRSRNGQGYGERSANRAGGQGGSYGSRQGQGYGERGANRAGGQGSSYGNRQNQGYGDRTGRSSYGDRGGSRYSQGGSYGSRQGQGYGDRTGQGSYGDRGGSRYGQGGTYGNRQGQGSYGARGGRTGRPYSSDGQGRSFGGGYAGRKPGSGAAGGNRFGMGGGLSKNESRGGKPMNKKERELREKTKQDGLEREERYGEDGVMRRTHNSHKPQPAQPKQPAKKEEVIKTLTLPESLTIGELAEKMKKKPAELIKDQFMKGNVYTINTQLTYDQAEEIAIDYDIICEKEEKVDVIAELLKDTEDAPETLVPRPPVVCVMGHVDHGKTSLLDAIRSSHVTEGEKGGITQKIGAYTVNVKGQQITFLDTPGHEAFTAMRMRGAQATDIAVLVVAADDGVMPQTIEAINHARAAKVDIIVAVNKIDKPGANIDLVKKELSEQGLVPEDWGGSTIFCPVSAKTHEGIDNLLDMILLDAEVLELKANPNRKARGIIIEAQLDKGRGPVATVLVQKGTLHVGDTIAAGASYGKVRAMIDDRHRRVKEAGPSTPVEVVGLSAVPEAGEILVQTDSEKDARSFAETFIKKDREKLLAETRSQLTLENLNEQIREGSLKELNLIIKADVQGSVEALKQSLLKLTNDEVAVRIIHSGVGAINESDVILASASDAVIIGFSVKPDSLARQVADREKVEIRLYSVIYQVIADVESAMKGMLAPVYEEKVTGHAEIRQIFKSSSAGTIGGSYVTDGVIQRGCKVRISREGKQIFEGNLASLKRFKDDVKEVREGFECGLVFEKFSDIAEGDIVEAYIMQEVPR
ncbi:MAG: translation initiation factor IF-2 [Lachnospiraceae bacterium]|jgi:translation initiation factor IF-2